MTGITLQDVLSCGESETIEFKESFQTEVIHTAVAFANTRGGKILLGIDNSGRAVGITFGRKALPDIINRIAAATEPTLIPDIELTALGAHAVCIISVSEYPLKLIATKGRCYRRAGSSIRRMTEACSEAGLRQPLIDNQSGGFTITFLETNRTREQVGEQVTIMKFCSSARTKRQILTHLGLKPVYLNFKRHIVPMLDHNFLEMTIPDKPNSRLQKYQITAKGQAFLQREK